MLVWLFEVNIGGEVRRFSSLPIEFDGKQWFGGMDSLNLRDQLGIGTGAPDSKKATIDIIPNDDISLLLSYGHDVSVGTANLFLWDSDEPEYLAKRIFYEATVELPEVGGKLEILSFSLSAEPYEDTSTIISQSKIATVERLFGVKILRTSDYGRAYPIVYGTPGYVVNGSRVTRVPAYRAIVNEAISSSERADSVMVAGHVTDKTTTSNVRLWWDASGTFTATSIQPLLINTDNDNNEFSYVDVSGLATVIRDAPEFYVSIDDDPTTTDDAKLHSNASAESYILTVGDLIEHLAFISTVPTDAGSFSALKQYFTQDVGIAISDELLSPMDLLLELIRDLPIGLYASNNGLAAVYVDTDYKGYPSVTLIDGLDSFRVSSVRFLNNPEDIITSVTVRYAYNAYTEEYTEAVTSSFEEWSVDDETSRITTTNAYVRSASAGSNKGQRTEVVELPWAYNQSLAKYVSKWISRYKCVSPKVISILVPQKKARSLTLGQTIDYTNEDLNLDKRATIITMIETSDSDLWEIELTIFGGTVSDKMATGDGGSSVPPILFPPQP